MGFCSRLGGEPQYLETVRAGTDPGSELSHLGLALPRDRDLGRFGPGHAMDSGRGITSGGSGFAAILAHAEGALYGTELGSVTFKLKRIGFFCFPIKQHTHWYKNPKIVIDNPPKSDSFCYEFIERLENINTARCRSVQLHHDRALRRRRAAYLRAGERL